MLEEHRNVLLSTASVVLSGQRGSLKQQLSSASEMQAPAAFAASGNPQEQVSRPLPFLELPYFNGLGGFTPDGREYAIYLKPRFPDAFDVGERDGEPAVRRDGDRKRAGVFVVR